MKPQASDQLKAEHNMTGLFARPNQSVNLNHLDNVQEGTFTSKGLKL